MSHPNPSPTDNKFSPQRGDDSSRAAHRISAAVERLRPELMSLSREIHEHPEIGFAEHRSVRTVAEFLEGQGFATKIGEWGLSTSILAQQGKGSPRVAILAEYDALPGVGHGCGHNVICAAAVGAFIGLAQELASLDGTVRLIGTPAEENGGGKEVLARAGAFDDIDAIVMLHPFTGPEEVANFASLAVRDVEATFRGTAAHASSAPHEGRNALDAALASYQGIAALRQHILATDRLHAIVSEGGAALNVVPDRAGIVVEVRSASTEGLRDLSHRVQRVLEGAAHMMDVRLETRWDPFPPYLPVRSNAALAGQYLEHMRARGRQIETGSSAPSAGGWSTDLGNLSVRVPAIHPTISISPEAVPMHTEEFGRRAISDAGDTAVIDGAIGLAATVADYLRDSDLRERVRLEFEAAGGRIDVERLLTPPDRDPADRPASGPSSC
ncbi:amidohydrolase [Leucobacter sp. CSA2]|uniref:Peptidase M20 domain-containing protein 2 n=2 Tax=Leucobacter edaphi TaxID=2796472 RepID=A0A934QF03_9MICO|nr:amidohydrolase [Leucobacter edaphi]